MIAEALSDLAPPARFDRAHVLVRILLVVTIGAVGGALGWPGGLVYLGLPALVAIRVAQRGANAYLTDDLPIVQRVLSWLLGLYAYMAILTDHFPTGDDRDELRFEVTPHGEPTVARAALRVFTSLPWLIALCFIGIASGFVWFVSMISVAATGRYPRAFFDLQRWVLQLHARFLAYHASLVDEVPPAAAHLAHGAA